MAYRYRLEYATRSQLITPKSAVKVTVAKEQDEAFFREKVSGSITLTGDDYVFLKDAETYSVECCQEITFIIERTCEEEIFWEGYFTLYNVKWDDDNREATIQKLTVRDQYTAVFANWHKEINWFGDIPPHRPAAAYDPVQDLVPFTHTALQSEEFNPTGSNLYPRGFYFNAAILFLIKQTFKGTPAEVYSNITTAQMSDFLTLPTNPANGKTNYLPQVIMMHISDAKRPGASEPAWRGNVTLRDLLTNLKLLYNAYWYIDEDNRFRIEHISYFKNFSYTPPGVTIDLTEERFAEKMVGKNNYEYAADELKGREGVEQSITLSAYDQKSEVWTQFANPSSREFSSVYMNYADNCVPKDEKGVAAESYQSISMFTTDWRTVTYKPDTVADQGWLLVYVPNLLAENAVAPGWLPIANEYMLNGNLAQSRLFYEFGRTDLSFQYGMMTYEKQTKPASVEGNYIYERPMRAKSTKRIKTFGPVELSMCCGETYDFTGFIKHPLADECVVSTLEFDLENESVTLNLVTTNNCDNIPFPEYVEIEEPSPTCPEQGTLVRTEETSSYTAHTAINYVRIIVYTDYYADGECGEYSKSRQVREVTPKRQNGPR
ncbi:MAG TPA: hypothetical protein VLG47_06110 [Candidatus Saccharimonadales bacterium]|nr:hypothetical protein [Candidatus Saccharimonadales bacterium]